MIKNQPSASITTDAVPPSIDIVAISLSAGCLLHCLALPVLSALLPVLGVVSEAEWIHKGLVLVAIPFSGYAAFTRGKRFRDRFFVALVLAGLSLLLAAAFVERLHDIETPVTVLGAVLLASAHLWRWRRHGETSV